jgi:D-beta-D-heptose 7-phosphate kinase/D-beta-D-heptose 1-phosphate adenosyltransferase
LIEAIQPDVLVKGEDYKPKEVLGREHAKKTVCIAVGVDFHTSDLIAKIRNL